MPLKREQRNGLFVRLCSERGRPRSEGGREAASMKSGEFKMRERDNEERRTDGWLGSQSARAPCDLLLLLLHSMELGASPPSS